MYANISFLNSDKGISSQEDGTFRMYIDEKVLKNKIHISCLNYKDTIVLAEDLQNKILFLQPKVIVLDEVIISKRVDKRIVLDRVKREITAMHSRGMRMLAKYFPNNKKYECCNYISKIDIHFRKRQHKQSKFRIRIFDRDSITGLPKNDLLHKNIPITIDKDEDKVSLDMTDFDIEMPKDGFFIAFEKLFIPFNEYSGSSKDPKATIFYSPVIGITKSKEFKKIDRNFVFVKGKWQSLGLQKLRRMKGYVPAISVTLSN